MHKQINSPGKPARQAIKRESEREEKKTFFKKKPRASESARSKQLPKGKRARRLKKERATGNLIGAQERREKRESSEARSDLGTRSTAIRREIKQNPTNPNRDSEMCRNLGKTRISPLYPSTERRIGAKQAEFGQGWTKTERKQNPNTAAPHSGAPRHETQPQNRIIRQNSAELARRAHLAGVYARPPPIALGSPPRCAAPRPDSPRSLSPCGIIPPPLPLGAPSSSSSCFSSPLLFLLPFSPFTLLALLSALRLGFFFWWWRCVVRWCGLAKTPQNHPPFLNPPTPPRLRLRPRHPGEGRPPAAPG